MAYNLSPDAAPQPGLYTPQLESDACGTGLFVNLDNRASSAIVDKALRMLEHMEHRGACGCEPESGDGAGITVHLPHTFYQHLSGNGSLSFFLPDLGTYGTGIFFMPKAVLAQTAIRSEIERAAERLKFEVVGYREIPTHSDVLGPTSRSTEPYMTQPFFATAPGLTPRELDRRLYVLRKLITKYVQESLPQHAGEFYACSLSSRIITYKGQLSSTQVRPYF